MERQRNWSLVTMPLYTTGTNNVPDLASKSFPALYNGIGRSQSVLRLLTIRSSEWPLVTADTPVISVKNEFRSISLSGLGR